MQSLSFKSKSTPKSFLPEESSIQGWETNSLAEEINIDPYSQCKAGQL